MSDKTLEDKAVEILDASQAAMGAFADKLGELAKQYGHEVADAALQMARIDAVAPFMWAVPLMGVGGIGFWASYRLIKKAFADAAAKNAAASSPDPTAYYRMSDGSGFFMASIVVGGGSLLAFIPSASVVFNLWRWVGIFEPKLWLAKRILGL